MIKLKLAGIRYDSIVDGPGLRLSLYVQGCSHRCYGCHNPETHDPAGGYDASLGEISAIIERARGIDGVTFSGGEPFEQAEALAVLAERVSACSLNLVLYSGYSFEQLAVMSCSDKNIRSLLEKGMLLVDGPFSLDRRDLNLAYRGSANQRLIDLPRSLGAAAAVLWQPEWSGGELFARSR